MCYSIKYENVNAIPKMTEVLQNGRKSDNIGKDLLGVLEEINVSAFLDKWGPTSVIQIYDPEIDMKGIVVIDNIALGPACGGLRICPEVTPRMIFNSARSMTFTCALADVRLGGGASGIKASPSEINKSKFLHSFARLISSHIPEEYIVTPDKNMTKRDMAALVQELGDTRAATGKPESMGGIPYEIGVVGFGVSIAIEAFMACSQGNVKLPCAIPEVKVAIQGFGVVGSTISKFMTNKGAKVVAISDDWVTIHDPNGLDMEKVSKHVSADNEERSLKSCKGMKHLSIEDIIKVDCDIFIPTTGCPILTESNLDQFTAKCLVEGINSPINSIVDRALNNRGVTILPDVLTMAGGAISSYSECLRKSPELTFSTIESKVKEKTACVYDKSSSSDIPLRRTAIEMAKERILDATEVF